MKLLRTVGPEQEGEIAKRIEALGPWFQNMKIGETWTAPDHFLGDYPGEKFRRFAPILLKNSRLRGR